MRSLQRLSKANVMVTTKVSKKFQNLDLLSNKVFVLMQGKTLTFDAMAPVIATLDRNVEVTTILLDEGCLKTLKTNPVLDAFYRERTEIWAFFSASNIRSFRIIIRLVNVFRLILLMNFRRGVLFHFGSLHRMPLSWIRYFFGSKIYHVDKDIFRDRRYSLKVDHFGREKTKSQNKDYSSEGIIPQGRSLIVFDEVCLDNFDTRGKDLYIAENIRHSQQWNHWLHSNRPLFNKLTPSLQNNKYVVMLACHLPKEEFLEYEPRMMLKKTLSLISKTLPDKQILVKPHFATDRVELGKIINSYENVLITDLHPHVLTWNAICFVCNLYSFVIADAFQRGVETIEFTRYKPVLRNAIGEESTGAEFVSHFIDFKNEDEFVIRLQKTASLGV